ncbi:serine protease FAM111A-like [Hoplias malabaricus]|uniref:serine protease FAM111A-like n=1 Tax=Hoplias malabaricus TaxID=27720 RepID=UPI0034620DB5
MNNKRKNPCIADYFQRKTKNIKVEGEQRQGEGTATQTTESTGHAFKFFYQKTEYQVTCSRSSTVLEALVSNSDFRQIHKKNKGKDIVIQRNDVLKAAISTEFPCFLIHKDELLEVKFIQPVTNSGNQKKPDNQDLQNRSAEDFIVFNVKTTGGEKIKRLMKNLELKKVVDNVCVYALKGEKVKRALKRDGRFSSVIFEKRCTLIEQTTNVHINMSNTVDHLDGNYFKIIVRGNQPDSQESSQELDMMGTGEEEYGEASSNSVRPQSETTDLLQDSDNVQQQQQQTAQSTTKETRSKSVPVRIKVKEIPDTDEILKLLRDQFQGLLEQVKERERLSKPAEVRKLFREEYDKKAQSFSEVRMLKKLMPLCDSVCVICVEGSAKGTGFLLFHRFILTNAHVIEDVVFPETLKLCQKVTVAFGFEDLDIGKEMKVKDEIVAGHKGKNNSGQHLDFALLELSDDEDPAVPELLKNYHPSPIHGGICIIGHPGGGIKKMDPCFIIEDIPAAYKRHLAENKDFVHIITQQCLGLSYCPSQISYNSCFFHGASGSPVFNEYCQLIGVHTGGYVYQRERGCRSVMEYALPMLPILVYIITQCRERNRSDVVELLKAQNNMKLVFEEADQQNQGNPKVV